MSKALNLRNVDPKVIHDLKVGAVSAGMTLREYCLDLLDSHYARSGTKKAAKVVLKATDPTRKPNRASRRLQGAIPAQETALTYANLTRKDIQEAKSARPGHDPKTCRVRGCLMCKVAKGEK